VTFDPTTKITELAARGPALFFPDAPAAVTFNFDQGLAAEETFPLDDFEELMTRVLRRDQGRALEYISFGYDEENDQIEYLPTYIELMLGYTGLREQAAKWIGRTQDLSGLGPDNLILTSGSVQAIALAVNAFVNPGDGVIIEQASFPYAIRFLEQRGANIRHVDMDEHGMQIDSLVEALEGFKAEGVTPKLIYTIPTFQLPTMVVMPVDRRRRLIEIAEEYDLLVLEDSIYADLRFDGDPVPSLLHLDTTGRVMQSHGFSKVLAPALRIGWITASEQIIAALAAVRQDLGVSQWICRMLEEFLIEGKMDAHIEKANAVYKRKCDLTVAAIEKYCGGLLEFQKPQGGFYLWLRVAENVDWEKAQHQAALNGVFCRPGEKFGGAMAGKGYMRLAFSHAPDHEIERGIKALGEAILQFAN